MKQRLHSELDGATVAAQNNDMFRVLMGLGNTTEGLGAISSPSYFQFDAPLPNNGRWLQIHRGQARPIQTREQQHQRHLPTINLTQQEEKRLAMQTQDQAPLEQTSLKMSDSENTFSDFT